MAWLKRCESGGRLADASEQRGGGALSCAASCLAEKLAARSWHRGAPSSRFWRAAQPCGKLWRRANARGLARHAAVHHQIKMLLLAPLLLLRPPPLARTTLVCMRGPPVSELRKRLADFGIATDAVFEKKELLRLLEEAEQRRPPKPQLPPIESMDLQAVMGELEDRGVGFDVLAPEPSLYALLKKARAKAGQQATAAWAARVATPPPARAPVAPPPSAPPPSSSSSAAAGAQERRTTRGASPHRDLGSFAVDAVSTTVGVAKATAENLAPKVGGVIDQLGVVPAAAAAASSPKAKRVRGAVKRSARGSRASSRRQSRCCCCSASARCDTASRAPH